VCRSTDRIIVSSVAPHYGEEPPLVGSHGSGTIFFSSCNLKCQFCQNYEISHLRSGRPISIPQLAGVMLLLQNAGCHNINLVTPTHVTPQIVEALALAVDQGLSVPLVYNCGGYESVHTLSLLRDIVDIYMPDIKYSGNENARRYSGAKDYWDVVRKAVREMQNQVGCLQLDEQGIAVRGLLIRHLVLPNNIAGSREVLEFVACDVSPNSYVNIMDQYRPMHRAGQYRELNRALTFNEYREVVKYASHLGLRRGRENLRVS
jgi:putative pyruvate formate lyase activating enzyme